MHSQAFRPTDQIAFSMQKAPGGSGAYINTLTERLDPQCTPNGALVAFTRVDARSDAADSLSDARRAGRSVGS